VVVAPDRLSAEFRPERALDAVARYELSVSTEVRDVLGSALEARVSVSFATSSSAATAGSIEFLPGSEAVALGDSVSVAVILHSSRGLIYGAPVVHSSSDPTIAEFVTPTTVYEDLWLRGLRPARFRSTNRCRRVSWPPPVCMCVERMACIASVPMAAVPSFCIQAFGGWRTWPRMAGLRSPGAPSSS
jgi:hypothetical protein